MCETWLIDQKPGDDGKLYTDWDDTMKTMRMVRPSEYKKIMKAKEDEERKRKEEAEAAALIAQKKKPPAKKKEADEPEIEIDETEESTVELIQTITEVEHEIIEGSEKHIPLKTSLVADYARYECQVSNIEFKPTLMYASRTFKFTVKNTSLINISFNFKIVNSQTGVLDAGPYSIIPKKGTIAPGCDDNFVVKFSPMEIEQDFSRILSANIPSLEPESEGIQGQNPLIMEINGIAERPIIHFELPPTNYKEKKAKDMTPIESKYKIIEFDSLGTQIKNTRRFMAVNPTA